MKKKDFAWAAFGILFISVLAYGIYSFTVTPDTGVRTRDGVQRLELVTDRASLTVTAYDIDGTVEDDKRGGTFNLLDASGRTLETAEESDGVYTVDADTGRVKKGDRVTIVFKNNSDDGSYLAQATIDITAGGNAVDLPVHKVGDISVSFNSQTVTIGANSRKNIEIDLDTDNKEEYFYKPILAFKDLNSTVQVFATGEITDMAMSGATKVNCDTDVISGYSFCLQLDQEWVSSHNIIDDAKVYFESGSTNPSGYANLTIIDGVPGASAGVGSINDADAYDTDMYSAVITVG